MSLIDLEIALLYDRQAKYRDSSGHREHVIKVDYSTIELYTRMSRKYT